MNTHIPDSSLSKKTNYSDSDMRFFLTEFYGTPQVILVAIPSSSYILYSTHLFVVI